MRSSAAKCAYPQSSRINLARVLAQSIYYVHAFTQIPAEKSEQVEFVVPTGTFGNVYAGVDPGLSHGTSCQSV